MDSSHLSHTHFPRPHIFNTFFFPEVQAKQCSSERHGQQHPGCSKCSSECDLYRQILVPATGRGQQLGGTTWECTVQKTARESSSFGHSISLCYCPCLYPWQQLYLHLPHRPLKGGLALREEASSSSRSTAEELQEHNPAD